MARIRNNRNICLNCFGDLNSDRVCSSCGKHADDTPNSPHQLPKRSLLRKRYLIDRAIGEGGFGITYSAWDITTGKHVAIKEFYPSGYVSRDPRSCQIIINSKNNHAMANRGLKRFIDEAQHLSSVNNLDGIVNVYDFFSANNTAYIVMEYLDGISLKRYVKRKGKLDATTVLTILKPVILSLEAVHKTGLIHRDISPDNILITKTNEVKLIDFGASKEANPDGQSVSIVLKQGFAPEEQYRLHGEQGPWTDVYALGVTIYYCITGQLPPESIQRMYDDTIIPPSQLGAKITKQQESALMKALAVFAKDRYRSMADFAADAYKSEEPEVTETIRSGGITMRVESDGQIGIDEVRSEQIKADEQPIVNVQAQNDNKIMPSDNIETHTTTENVQNSDTSVTIENSMAETSIKNNKNEASYTSTAKAQGTFVARDVYIDHKITPKTLRRLFGTEAETNNNEIKNETCKNKCCDVVSIDATLDTNAEPEITLSRRTEVVARKYANFAVTLRSRLIG